MAWVSYRNWLLTADLVASAQVATLPVGQVRTPKLGRRWRVPNLSQGASSAYLRATLKTSKTNAVALFVRPHRRSIDEEETPPSFLATDKVRHRLFTDNTFTTATYDSGVINSGMALGYGYTVHMPTPTASQHYEFWFDGMSRITAPENYVDWGYGHLGAIDLEPEIGFAAPMEKGFSEGAIRRFSDDGGTMTIRRKRGRRRFELVFRSLKEMETPAVEAFLEYAGDGGVFVLGLDRTDMARGVIVGVLDTAAYSRGSRKFWGMSLPILEAI